MTAQPVVGILLMCAATLCFALLDANSKYLSQTFNVPLLVWARYSFHCLLMLVFLAPRLRWRLLFTRRPIMQVSRGLLLVAVTGCAMAAFQVMPLAETTALLFISPLLVALLAGPLLQEAVTRARWLAALAGFLGVLLVARPGGALTWQGLTFVLVAAVCYALYQIQTRQLSASEDTWTLLFYTALIGTLTMSLALPLIWHGPAPSLAQTLHIASLGIFGGGGHWLLIRAFRHAPATTLAPFLYVQLPVAGLFGWLWYDHLPDSAGLTGMALIVASSLALALHERRMSRLRQA